MEAESVIAVIVAAADALSAARPGARRVSWLHQSVSHDLKSPMAFEGVQNSFALQAGREIRIMVNQDRSKTTKSQSWLTKFIEELKIISITQEISR